MRSKKKSKLRVALAFPVGLAFTDRLMHGILDYAREHGDWSFARLPEMIGPSIDWLREWTGDGAFVLLTNADDAERARRLAIPVVNLAGHLAEVGVPSVTVDHRAIGVLAAEHLQARRFSRFGFYGVREKLYSAQRREGFVAAVERAGGSCAVLQVEAMDGHAVQWVDQLEELENWLRTLEPPVGVMASTDLRAGMVVDACQRLGLRVPEDVAVIGVDNDPVACEFREPGLSSVSRNDHEVGYRAAGLLERLIAGNPVPRSTILVSPDAVVSRQSTEVMAIDDPLIARVVQAIENRLHEPFSVDGLLEGLEISRRRLEQRFRHSLGCGPAEFIKRRRVEQAMKLLVGPTRHSLTDIAAACGFSDLRHFRQAFGRVCGKSPSAYRQNQEEGAPGMKN